MISASSSQSGIMWWRAMSCAASSSGVWVALIVILTSGVVVQRRTGYCSADGRSNVDRAIVLLGGTMPPVTTSAAAPNGPAPSYPIESVGNALKLLLMFRDQRTIRVADAGTGAGRGPLHRRTGCSRCRVTSASSRRTRSRAPTRPVRRSSRSACPSSGSWTSGPCAAASGRAARRGRRDRPPGPSCKGRRCSSSTASSPTGRSASERGWVSSCRPM